MNSVRELTPENGEPASTSFGRSALPMRGMWISWNVHRRTSGLCKAWNLPLHVIQTQRNGWLRWVERVVRTIALLRREQPEILLVQNPSLALTLLAILLRRLFGYYLVVDGHNEGVRPFERPGTLVRWLTRRALKGADTTIVTNAALASDVTAAGGRPLILPDCLPLPPPLQPARKTGEAAPLVVVIATFRPDEPIPAILAAAASLPEVRFAVSGAAARFRRTGAEVPGNVRLTGHLPDPAYWRLLAQADVILDLTLKPDCLVCGAYEGLALAKPLVLSDNPATREIFAPAAVLTGSAPDEIATAVRTAVAERERLAANARMLRDRFRARWATQGALVWNAILAGTAEASRADTRHSRT